MVFRKAYRRILSHRSSQSGEGRSSSSRRQLLSTLSLPGRLPPDAKSASIPTVQDLQEGLKKLENVISELREQEDESPPKDICKNLRLYFQHNIPQFGTILDKIGAAANGQVPAVSSQTNVGMLPRGGAYEEVAKILKGLGNLHWAGAFLIVLGVVVERYAKVTKNKKDVSDVLGKLCTLGRLVIKFDSQKGGDGSEVDETLKRAVKQICGLATDVDIQAANSRKSCLLRLWQADSDGAKLADIYRQIDQLYSELHFAYSMAKDPIPSEQRFESDGDSELVGAEERVDEAYKKLENKNAKVSGLILTGMPGCGTSTIGRLLAAKVMRERPEFDRNVCWLDFTAREGSVKVEGKQQELYDRLSKQSQAKICTPEKGRGELRKYFQNRTDPVLIYIDNVSEEELSNFLPDDIGSLLRHGSILLVTASNEAVFSLLKKKGVFCLSYNVKELKEEEAKDLLSKQIFGDKAANSPESDLRKLMEDEKTKELLTNCGGVPMAVKAVGGYIFGRGHDFIRAAFGENRDLSLEDAYKQLAPTRRADFEKKMKKAMEHASQTLSDGDPISSNQKSPLRCLEFAYGQLSGRLQRTFLDIAHSHVWRTWSDVEKCCGVENLDALKQRSMVKRSVLSYRDGTARVIVDVHNLFVGVARKIENMPLGSSYDCPGKGRVVVGPGMDVENADALSHYVDQNPELRILKLSHCKEGLNSKQEYSIPAQILDRVVSVKLEQLHLVNSMVKGKCTKQPTKLKYLECIKSSLPFPLEHGGWSNLVILELDLEKDTTSDFSCIHSMGTLQKVNISNSRTMKELGPNLNNLVEVTVRYSPNFERIRGLNPDSVRIMKIIGCPKFNDFAAVGKLKCEKLSLVDCGHSRFPEDFTIPSEVEMLDLSMNEELEELPKLPHEGHLKRIYLRRCSNLQKVGEEVTSLTSLRYLNLEGCQKLEKIVVHPGYKLSLIQLDVRGCGSLRDRSKLSESFPPSLLVIGWKEIDGVAALPDNELTSTLLDVRRSSSLQDRSELHRSFRESSDFPDRRDTDQSEDEKAGSRLQRCLRWSLKRSCKIFSRRPEEFRGFKSYCTFPPSGSGKYCRNWNKK